MDDLPDLPFSKVLSYLNLRDRLMLRAVSRSCHEKIANSRVKSLCYSQHPIGRILGKSRWVSGTFAVNFIRSTRFATFFDTFGQTILSSLKRLRLCELNLSVEDQAAFVRTLNSFSQLEQLDIIGMKRNKKRKFKLNLPMLTSLQLEDIEINLHLILEAPRLRDVKLLECSDLWLEIVHGESVERLITYCSDYVEVKNLKNLQYLCIGYHWDDIDPSLLSSLRQLKEFHTNDFGKVSELFEQKQQFGLADLKIYFCGLLLNGPDDPAMDAFPGSLDDCLGMEAFAYLAENSSRLADQIPLYRYICYSDIEDVALDMEVDLLKRFTDLNEVVVYSPARDIQRLLDLLKSFENNISSLEFRYDHPQELFDRLSEYCTVQKLKIDRPPSDLAFLFRLKHLIDLQLHWQIDIETVRRAFEELPLLSSLKFTHKFRNSCKIASIQTCHPKEFHVSVGFDKKTIASDLNAAITFIFGKKKSTRSKKRKADAMK